MANTNGNSNLGLNLHIAILCWVAATHAGRLNVFDTFRIQRVKSDLHTYLTTLGDEMADHTHAKAFRALMHFARYDLPKMVSNIRGVDGWAIKFDCDEVYARRAV